MKLLSCKISSVNVRGASLNNWIKAIQNSFLCKKYPYVMIARSMYPDFELVYVARNDEASRMNSFCNLTTPRFSWKEQRPTEARWITIKRQAAENRLPWTTWALASKSTPWVISEHRSAWHVMDLGTTVTQQRNTSAESIAPDSNTVTSHPL